MRKATLLHPVNRPLKRSKEQILALEEQRKQWISEIHPTSLFHRLFDFTPGIYFFAKDLQGKTMFASRGILDLYQMKEESEMLGLTDHDLNPAVMAENYVRDDALLLSGKATHLERLELWFDRTGMPDWFVVTKLPIVTTQSRFIGVMGMLRRASESDKQLPVFQTVARSVELIRRDYATPIRMADVAQKCGQSLRQLQRHFQSAFGTTPQEFLLRTRISAAIRLLEETRLSIEEIALRCGFVDASAFILHFRQRTNQTPRQYQRLHQASSKHAS